MADDIRTVRDAANAIRSVRTEMRIYAGVAAFVAMIALGFMGWGFNKGFDKIDRLEELTVRLDTRLEGIEKKIDKVAGDTAAIRTNVETASLLDMKPNAASFQGYIGVKADEAKSTLPALIQGDLKDAWIFTPATNN